MINHGVPKENESFGKKRSHYRVIERFNYLTLLECELETGRIK